MNAVKHGLRARTLVLPGESDQEYRNWRQATISSLKPRDEFEYRLACRTADAEWVRERADNVLHARLATYIDEADLREDDYIYILCKALFWDLRGAHPMYGLSPRVCGGPGTSSSDGPDDPTDPHLIVGQLERSPKGCQALIGHWQDLLSRIKDNLGWQSPDRLKAIRMLGKQPVDVALDQRIVTIYVGSFAIKPGNRLNGYGDLKSDMGTLEYKRFLRRVRSRWPMSISAADPAAARQALFDLIERNIERLQNRLDVYRECADVRAEREAASRAFEDTAVGGRVRQYKDACDRGLSRSIGDYWKNRKASNREGGESSAEDGGLDFTEVVGTEAVGGEIVAGLEVGGEVVASDENLANAPELDRKSTRLNSSHMPVSRMPSSA